MVAVEEGGFSSHHPKANNRYCKEKIVKSLELNRFKKWKAARAWRTKKAMLDLLWVVLSMHGVGRLAGTQKTQCTVGAGQFPLLSLQPDWSKNSTWASSQSIPRIQYVYKRFLESQGVAKCSLCSYQEEITCWWNSGWFSQLVEVGAGGKPILFLVWNRYLPGMTGTISRFQHRLFIGYGYMKKPDTKQLEYCHYWE